MSFDSLKVYARNHNTPIYYNLASAAFFIVAKFFLYGFPANPTTFMSTMAQYFALCLICIMAILHQRRVYERILAQGPADNYWHEVIVLAVNKIILMVCWLVFLFYPLKTAFLYDHLVGYGFIFCATAMSASISAACVPLFYLEVGIQLVFVMGLVYLNQDMPEIRYVVALVGMFTLYTLLIGRKITQTTRDLLRMQKDLEHSAQVAERANRSKSEFLAMMSHEIRTPMTGVLGMVDFLKETPLRADQQSSLDTISECSKTLLNTLNDVLDISRMEAGKLAISPVNFDFHAALMNSYKILKPYAEQKGLVLERVIEKDVPVYAYGDPSRLQQIVNNLINNAVKFTHQGGVTLTVTYKAEMLRIEVKDTGIGISESNIKRLFQKFSQADGSISRKYGGSGLGLSISKQLAELMGGSIGVASEKGQGSVFWFEIPYRKPIAEKKPGKETQTFLNLPPQNILLVEDNEINQVIATRLLTKKGHSVAVAVDGETALQMLKSASYDVILMDCSLPGRSGIDITRDIKKLEKKYANIPIIAVTANAMEDNLRKCREAGMVDYVTKPFSSSQLYLALARNLRIRIGVPEKIVMTSAAPLPAAEKIPVPPGNLNQKLMMVYEEFGPEYTANLVTRSVTEIHRLIKGVQDSATKNDYDGIYRHAHDLKGISGYIGMVKTQEISEKIEKACAHKDYVRLPEMVQGLVDDSRREIGTVEDMARQATA